MLQFGMPTLIEAGDIETCISLCKDLNLDFIELNMNFPQYQLDRINTSYYKKIGDSTQIFYTIHLEEEFNPCGYNKAVTKAYLDTMIGTIAMAKVLKAPVLNMHMADGIYITLPHNKIFLYQEYQELYLEKLKEFRELCEKAIGEDDIIICIENSGGFKDFTKKGIELLLESKVFALTFDLGHNHSIGGSDEAFIRDHKERLKHMHIHDAVGKSNHLAVGTGEIDMVDKLDLAKECNCRCVLETKTIAGLRESVNNIKTYCYSQ